MGMTMRSQSKNGANFAVAVAFRGQRKDKNGVFTTREFKNFFYSSPIIKELPDEKMTRAQDVLATLVDMGLLVRPVIGVYKWLRDPVANDAKQFNRLYPKVRKGIHSVVGQKRRKEVRKNMQRKTKPKKVKPEGEGLGLVQLGRKIHYQLDNPDINILETFLNKHPDQLHLVTFSMPRDEFSSLCPVTGAPDQAKMEVIYAPNEKMVESKSLKLYFFAYRNHGAFHEDIVNTVAKDLWKLLSPKYLRVFGNFSPRGGIAIKPLVEKWEELLGGEVVEQIDKLVTSWDVIYKG